MSNVVGKAELADRLAEEAQVTKKVAVDVVNGLIKVITGALVQGEDILIKGFGKFSLNVSRAREGRNPQKADEVIQIAPTIAVKFKTGSDLKDYVNTADVAKALAKGNKDDKDLQDRLKAWQAAHK